jgi:putative N6-adenine-specific DNA methylase
MPSSVRHETFTVCLPGLEPFVAAELLALGARPGIQTGGVRATLSPRQLGAAHLHLRTATRLLVRVGRFESRTFAAFQGAVAGLDWAPFIAPGTPVRVRATSHGSALWHTGAVAERVLTAIPGAVPHHGTEDGTEDGSVLDDGGPPDQAGTQTVFVRVDRDRVTVSIDASGEPLHRRGWRGPTAKAPLRSTLAAAMVLASGWDGRRPLIDPFCGSGTIPVEAALLARGLPPGGQRGFAFQAWPRFEPGTWASVVGAARAGVRPAAGVPILARDRDDGAVAATRTNAGRAGVGGDLDVERATISDLAPPPGTDPGWVLTNPPYGHRVRGGADLRDLYARLGQVVGGRLPGWHVGLLVGDTALAGHTRLPLTPRWRSSNGGIPVHFLATGPEGPA